MSKAIPKDWALATLSDMAEIDPESLKSTTSDDYEFKYIDIASVSTGRIDLPSESIRFVDAPSRARRKVRAGDVLMSTVRPNLKAFAYFDKSINECVASTGFAVIRAKNGNVGRFIFNSILSDGVSRQIDGLVVGSNYPAINSSDVRALEVLKPPIKEQQKIASILTAVDEVIASTAAQINKLKDLKTGMMQELLTKGIGHTEFKDSPVGRIPKAWEVVKLGSVLEKIDSGWSPNCIEIPPNIGEWGVLKVSSVTRGTFLEEQSKTLPVDFEPRESIRVGKDDLLLTRANGVAELVGKCVIVKDEPKRKLMMSDKLLRLKPNGRISRKFLLHVFNSSATRKQIEFCWGGSSGQKNIGQADIKAFDIVLPKLEEQISIGNALTNIDEFIDAKTVKLTHVNAVKSALMQDLLTGKVRVRAM